MPVANPFDKSHSEGLRLKLYKSVIPGRAEPHQWGFYLWGASNFLSINKFNSLSQFALAENDERSLNELDGNHVAENRFLYIYKNQEVNLLPDKGIDWIFQPDVDRPLLVITLLKADLSLIVPKVKDIASILSLNYDFFKTMGQGTGVVVTRCSAYSQAINCLIQLNGRSETTYSIAGAENPFIKKQGHRKKGSFLFAKLLETDDTATMKPEVVEVNYVLKEGNNKPGNWMQDVVADITRLRRKIIDDFRLSEQDLNVWTYYEIGRFDIEVRIEGHIVYILELLLNPNYGLANFESKFYKDYIFESRTTWKALSL